MRPPSPRGPLSRSTIGHLAITTMTPPLLIRSPPATSRPRSWLRLWLRLRLRLRRLLRIPPCELIPQLPHSLIRRLARRPLLLIGTVRLLGAVLALALLDLYILRPRVWRWLSTPAMPRGRGLVRGIAPPGPLVVVPARVLARPSVLVCRVAAELGHRGGRVVVEACGPCRASPEHPPLFPDGRGVVDLASVAGGVLVDGAVVCDVLAVRPRVHLMVVSSRHP